ncbi:MAG: hypothetical protein M3169_11665 [Candidatus Eremiobacteraeota bacterium]|nr:hypothetical protein [Candidatus Eremiobacteraeota bacterium]
MPHALAITAALAIAFAAAPTPKPEPFPLGTLQPFGTETPAPAANLPEIGRVRANSPVCAAMRDLIVPSFAAARRADARFNETRVRLPKYIEIADDPEHRTDVYRESALSKLDADATKILNETLILNKALGDPRFKDPTDPQVIAAKNQLQQLYATQQARANQLQEFVMRQRNEIAKNGFSDNSAFASRTQQRTPDNTPLKPPPSLNAPRGMPLINGKIAMADMQSLNEWSGQMAAAVRASENLAAHTFLPIAQSCR